MNILRVLLFMLHMLPSRGDADVRHRMVIAEAIVSATDDEHEQNLLASIARWESFYRIDVATCAVRGPQGELSAWQILPRNDGERRALCKSFEVDARIALARVRESLRGCRHLRDERERLAIYARGNCNSREGRRMSRTRWVRREMHP